MTPKTPDELRKQIKRQAKKPTNPGYERTPEGLEVPTPTRADFFSNLEKVSKPEKV